VLLSTLVLACAPPVGSPAPSPLPPVPLPASSVAGRGGALCGVTPVVYTSTSASNASWPWAPIPSTRRTSLRAASSAPIACGPWPYPLRLPSQSSPPRLGTGFSPSFGNSRLDLQSPLGAASAHRILADTSRGISSVWSGGRPRLPHLDSMCVPVHPAFVLLWTPPSSLVISFDQMAAAYVWPRQYLLLPHESAQARRDRYLDVVVY
jgi:hypothetical protein